MGIIYLTRFVIIERYNIFFVLYLHLQNPFFKRIPLLGLLFHGLLPTEKVHWIINSKYVRWRSVPFPFVHSNVVTFSYNFGCKYYFFVMSISVSPFHCFHTYWRQCGVASAGIRGKKKKTPNSDHLCKREQWSSPISAPVEITRLQL